MERLKILNDEIAYEGDFIRVIRRHFMDSNNNAQVWEMVERKTKTYGKVVAIAAVTDKKELILEQSYRIPIKSYVIELPAGLMDKKGESEEEAARRELLEETGYCVDETKLLFASPFNAGLMNDEIAIYLGTNAHFVKEPELESAEDIKVINVPLENLLDFILDNKDKIKVDAKLTAVIPYLEKFGYY